MDHLEKILKYFVIIFFFFIGHSLKLEVASTAAAMKTETANASENEPKVIINGYLNRFIDKLAEKSSTSTDKMTNKKLWRRRWFVLKSDACLYWYHNPKVRNYLKLNWIEFKLEFSHWNRLEPYHCKAIVLAWWMNVYSARSIYSVWWNIKHRAVNI